MTSASTALPESLDAAPPRDRLFQQLLWLALPVIVQNMLNMFVGLTDVYLAGHLRHDATDATAAVGSISYVLWLIGLLAGAIGTGSTALIARAIGARHQSLANSVCGQSVTLATLCGAGLMVLLLVFATPATALMGLSGDAHGFAFFYIRVLSLSLPFSMLMVAANACLVGAGDSLRPAIAMITVDLVNLVTSAALARGWWGLPEMGFRGIAIGTVTAYIVGGLIQLVVLLSGRGAIRLYAHRLRPHWMTLKRVLRIGIPSGAEGLFAWLANFGIIVIINRLDPTNVMPSAHIITVRVESMSFMLGLAFATAAATLVGQSLGMKRPQRAERAAYLAFALGAGCMAIWGAMFILFGRQLAHVLTDDPRVTLLTARCLFITGFAQLGFAGAMVFGGALRGAGDTFVVMKINLASILSIRLIGALIVGWWLRMGLAAIWVVLATELTLRGVFMYLRFRQGGWKHVTV